MIKKLSVSTTCRLCNSVAVDELINFGSQPIVHKLLKTSEAAYETYPFNLGYCDIINKLGLSSNDFKSILPPSRFLPDFWKDLINS